MLVGVERVLDFVLLGVVFSGSNVLIIILARKRRERERERERERGKKKHEHDGPVVLLPPALSAGAAAYDEPSARAPASGQWVRGWRGLQSPPQRRFCPSMLNSFAARIVGSSTQAGVECEKASFLSISKNVSRTRFEASHLFTTSHAHFNVCSHRKITGPTRKSAKGGWTPEEVGRRVFFF